MDIQNAVDNYSSAMKHCDNLIAVHRAAGSGGPGKRSVEPSVNRGTIVLAVASWQAFIQDVAKSLRDEALTEARKAATGTHLLLAAMDQWEIDFNAALEKFSTPQPGQVQSLLKRAGYDPRPHWTWNQRGGQGKQDVLVEPWHVEKVIFQWLRVRHDVAHGHDTITPLPILEAVRDPQSSAKLKAAPTLRLTDADDCVKFFRAVVRLTADGAAQHLGEQPPTWEKPPSLALGLHVSNLKK
ncbi:hypothetical protein [Streptomyces sp. NBC_00989]|uniref:hypothetical protein n=1 Tax=Streptomyces sp. NBC_00989 TaxID=2903705 RepID=UPI002F907092|nr:hypothetical protein OG714_54470 [Streptomyces sp. NBC_00989]